MNGSIHRIEGAVDGDAGIFNFKLSGAGNHTLTLPEQGQVERKEYKSTKGNFI
ncbi:MAG: hypothetical protein HWD58_15435 [Bacteroidota bacterium]|nr:MAG: hypothetical protein HWD58_15435 [Bacteroidota bacterium]